MKLFSYLLAIILISSCNIGLNKQSEKSYAYWTDNNSSSSWSKYTEQAVISSLLYKTTPKDIASFCPKYNLLKSESRIQFWIGLVSAMAFFESNFDPQAQYVEKFKDTSGKFIISRGLLQLSIESANQTNYSCDIESATDLHKAKVNLTCAVNILSFWVTKDHLISGSDSDIKGGGRYWSVLRPTGSKLNKIKAITKQLTFCKK